MQFKESLTVIGIIIAVVSYIPYIKDILANKTKPHAFSWFVWALLTAIGFFGQVADNAGPGAWVVGITAPLCLLVFFLAIFKGEKKIVLLDWLSLLGAVIAIGFWFFTKGPLLSVILVTIIDALGFIPTFRKSYTNPHQETLSTYTLSVIRYTLSLVALVNFSILTVLFPLSLVVTNSLFVLILIVRRLQMRK